MKILLDFAPLAIFLLVTLLSDVYKGTIALMISLVATIAIYRFWLKSWSKMHLVSAAIALVLGGLTLYLHDASFIKLKPTILDAGFALAFLGSHFIGKKVLVERIAGGSIALPSPVWRRINVAWIVFYAVNAVLNLYVAMVYSDHVWAIFKFVSLTVLPVLFILAHAPFLSSYFQAETPQDKGAA